MRPEDWLPQPRRERARALACGPVEGKHLVSSALFRGLSYSAMETGRLREDSAAAGRGSPELDRPASPTRLGLRTQDGLCSIPADSVPVAGP